MPLVFSPLSESLLQAPPRKLLPKHVFVMRQIGGPPAVDLEIFKTAERVFAARGVTAVDATGSTGSKDFLERILELIRSTGFTAAIFSHETKQSTLANIALELGFAAMCGKPLIILKSKQAIAPSDLSRTDWIEYDPPRARDFEKKVHLAMDAIESLHVMEGTLLDVAMEAISPDCAVALERANKGFLLSGDKRFVTLARKILKLLDDVNENSRIADLERQRSEVRTFIRQATTALKSL